jgi:hypothetical protein
MHGQDSTVATLYFLAVPKDEGEQGGWSREVRMTQWVILFLQHSPLGKKFSKYEPLLAA